MREREREMGKDFHIHNSGTRIDRRWSDVLYIRIYTLCMLFAVCIAYYIMAAFSLVYI